MKKVWFGGVLVGVLLSVATVAQAYTLRCGSADACQVYCNSGAFVGAEYWNGSEWSDGLRASPDRNVVAQQMVAAQGTACQ